MKFYCAIILAFAVTSVPAAAYKKLDTKLFVTLPNYCPVPDNLAVAPNGTLTLTCPNFKGGHPPVILSISAQKEVKKLTSIPGIKSGKNGVPMGLDYAPDGSLYVCNAQGRVNRLTFKGREVDTTDVIAEGVKCNGLKYHDGFVYVTQPKMPKIVSEHMTGGLYRFSVFDRDVKVTGKKTDSNLLFTAETNNPQRQVSLDGLAFDDSGKLYVAEFGDATVYQLTLNKQGQVITRHVYAQLPMDTGIDGMFMDKQNNLYITGFSSNRLIKVDAKQNISVLAEYPDNDGANGELDQPVDVAIFNDKLIVSNFGAMVAPDMVNTSHDKPYTLSYIDLEDL